MAKKKYALETYRVAKATRDGTKLVYDVNKGLLADGLWNVLDLICSSCKVPRCKLTMKPLAGSTEKYSVYYEDRVFVIIRLR